LNNGSIDELTLLDEIESINALYENEFGAQPINLSNWNPSSQVVNTKIFDSLPLIKSSGVDYLFSYELDNHEPLRHSLGYEGTDWRSLASHSGSSAIVLAINWLRSKGVKRVLIIGPRYFTVPHCLESMGIKHHIAHSVRCGDRYLLPSNIEIEDFDSLWVTNPVYGTGVYYDKGELIHLHDYWTKKGKCFVLDECLAEPNHYSGALLRPQDRTCVITAPHKAICVNGYKFALTLFHKSQLEHFEHWSDVWLGCLPHSSLRAIEHYLSGGYANYYKKFKKDIEKKSEKLISLTESIGGIDMDKNSIGYFRMVYFKSASAFLGLDLNFIKEATFSTGASFIPSIRNELTPSVGLSFRVNLAAFDPHAEGAYVRLASWIVSKFP
jgi:aspartate/methionine/tyrosine aminotransferase